ncbi:GtrA family protein [Lactococcus sp.]|uniref:GtrA family protein n=1 Tax=Lactococcus sp. TaxID=44273 RepID=UPI0035B2A051
MKKIISFAKTEAFKYLVFGVLTTLVYYIFMYGSLSLLTHVAGKASISEAIGQAISILFAFYTNKKWVFEHESNHVFLDFINFAAGRVFFMLIAIVLKWWFGDVHPSILMNLLHLDFNTSMLVFSLFIQILNIVLNYFYSKFLVFRKK